MENELKSDALPNFNLLPNLAKAVIKVMAAVRNIEKGMTVGTGNSSYKGVADKDVKYKISEAMAENGLCILPIGIDAKETFTNWIDEYKKNKQSITCVVKTKYLLLHESGESIELVGYGHGIDSQDKSAGKATTYALKYTLLYTFLVATGTIDDTDATHSDDLKTPPAKPEPKAPSLCGFGLYKAKEKMTEKSLNGAIARIKAGEIGIIEKAKELYVVSPEDLKTLEAVQQDFNKTNTVQG